MMEAGKSLVPNEAVRLAALGTLMAGAMPYDQLAIKVRFIISRVVGPSLDLLGSSLEIMRLEGLVTENCDQPDDQAILTITQTGQGNFHQLMDAGLKVPLDDVSRLVMSLKLMFLHHLEEEARLDQLDILSELFDNEMARLKELRDSMTDNFFCDWLDLEISQLRARRQWLDRLEENLT